MTTATPSPEPRRGWSDPARCDRAAGRLWDVVVVGAGVAGTIAARQLARQGLDVVVVERAEFPRDKVCGGCLSAAGMADLARIGLETLPERLGGHRLMGLDLRRGGHRLGLPLPGGAAVSRRALDLALADEADRAGATLLTSVTASLIPRRADRRPAAAIEPGRSEGQDEAAFTEESPNVGDATRSVRLTAPGRPPATLTGRIVLIATGLGPQGVPLDREGGQASAFRPDRRVGLPDEAFRRVVRPGSRIGLGCLVEMGDDEAGWADLPVGVVRMVGGPGGYVGLVRVEHDRIDVAAAVDPSRLSGDSARGKRLIEEVCLGPSGPAAAVAGLLDSAGLPIPHTLATASWRGTAALTRRTVPLAGDRVLLLGDATGYVEPFTGEGMGWAIAQALGASDLVIDAHRTAAAQDLWADDLPRRWTRFVETVILPRQRTCRRLAWILKRDWASRVALGLAGLCPPLTRRVVAPLHAVPSLKAT